MMQARVQLRVSVALALLGGFIVCASADETRPPSSTPGAVETMSLEGYALAAPRCAEWTDGCASCLRDSGGAHCSTPGVACQPGPIFCRGESDK
jgi:hypothetical protein